MRPFLRLIRTIMNIESILNEVLRNLERINPPEKEEEVWMDSFEVMNRYKISRSTLYRWKTQLILVPSRIGKRDLYLKADIEEILKRGRKESSAMVVKNVMEV